MLQPVRCRIVEVDFSSWYEYGFFAFSCQQRTYICSVEWNVLCSLPMHIMETVTWDAVTVIVRIFLILCHPMKISTINKWLLTILPCNIRLIWHHSLKGTTNGERNADDWSSSPFIWTCRWPVYVRKVHIMTLWGFIKRTPEKWEENLNYGTHL